MSSLRFMYRRAVYGKPLIVVSGLPRSGTSMMMRMLEAGGIPVWSDNARSADEQNPYGYFELERVKNLEKDRDKSWLRQGRGRAVKIVSSLLEHLPNTNNYQVLFMHRNLQEILASQSKMLAALGQTGESPSDSALKAYYETHLLKVKDFLSHMPAFRTLEISYGHVLSDATSVAREVDAFLGRDLDVTRMIGAVDERLYRNRR